MYCLENSLELHADVKVWFDGTRLCQRQGH